MELKSNINPSIDCQVWSKEPDISSCQLKNELTRQNEIITSTNYIVLFSIESRSTPISFIGKPIHKLVYIKRSDPPSLIFTLSGWIFRHFTILKPSSQPSTICHRESTHSIYSFLKYEKGALFLSVIKIYHIQSIFMSSHRVFYFHPFC